MVLMNVMLSTFLIVLQIRFLSALIKHEDNCIQPKEEGHKNDGVQNCSYNVGKINESDDCSLVFHLISFDETSMIPGVGVYAGKPIEANLIIERNLITYSNSDYYAHDTALGNFHEGVNSTHSGMTLNGYGAVYNHATLDDGIKMVDKEFNAPPYVDLSFSGEPVEAILYKSSRYIEKGDQIFVDYGSTWFETREFNEINPFTFSKEYVHIPNPLTAASRIPGCPLDTTKVCILCIFTENIRCSINSDKYTMYYIIPPIYSVFMSTCRILNTCITYYNDQNCQ